MKLSDLFNNNEFASRHISFADEAALLAALGEQDMAGFVDNTVPQSIRMPSELGLPDALTEADALLKIKGIAAKNKINKSYIGLGYYPTCLPNVILRNVLENPGWYTAYTPYQAEIAQGRLEALLNFQQVCIDLTGFEVAGASLLDEATAAAGECEVPPPQNSQDPSASPSTDPSATPSEDPSASSSTDPSATPSEDPSATPSGSAEPSSEPTSDESADSTPSDSPTDDSSSTPSSSSSPSPASASPSPADPQRDKLQDRNDRANGTGNKGGNGRKW